MDKQAALDESKRRRAIALDGGGPEKIARHRQRGHITARERIEALVDPGTFIEVGQLGLFQLPGSEQLFPASKLHGYGQIGGRWVSIQSDDSTVLAGTGAGGRRVRMGGFSPPAKGCPVVRFGESGGVHLQSVQGSIGVLAVTYPIRGLLNPRLVPRIIGMMGNCFGDPTWQAANSDFVVQVKGTCMAVSGPRVLGVALEEKTTPEELGGWRVHAEVTGQVDAFAEDDVHCARIIREFLGYMPSNCEEEAPRVETKDPASRLTENLMTIIPDDPAQTYNMLDVIRAIVDDGKFFLLKPFFAPALNVCLARLNGWTVGIIANQPQVDNGAIGPDECDKATDFIVMCDSFNIPLLFLVDTPGFAGGNVSEQKRLLTKSMHWLQALSLVTVPKLTLIVRKAYGMAATAMCGSNSTQDFIAALTSADIRSISPEVAAVTTHRERIERSSDPAAERQRVLQELLAQSSPFQAASAGGLDEIIDPRDARKYLIECLDSVRGQRSDFISRHLMQIWPTGF
ncbi:MAG: carboxyl transferase domain-containing protein [Dehalococcoidia bacterium]|nr:carboxyl transferase domain-containing protein [Dehalococcoidia bacterium]